MIYKEKFQNYVLFKNKEQTKMKITKRQLKRIIREEVKKTFEAHGGRRGKSKLAKDHTERNRREMERRAAERNAAKDKDSKKPVSEIEMSSLDDWSGQGNQDGAVALSNSGHGNQDDELGMPGSADYEAEAIEIAEYYGVDPRNVFVRDDGTVVVSETYEEYQDLNDLADGLSQGDY
jgi:hypothetical protein